MNYKKRRQRIKDAKYLIREFEAQREYFISADGGGWIDEELAKLYSIRQKIIDLNLSHS